MHNLPLVYEYAKTRPKVLCRPFRMVASLPGAAENPTFSSDYSESRLEVSPGRLPVHGREIAHNETSCPPN
jgi:hypothetical protein